MKNRKATFNYLCETYGIPLAFMLVLVIAFVVVSLLLSCDAHSDVPDTSVKTGHILCTDGTILPAEAYAVSKKEAVAVVFYINHDVAISGNGYAVYLYDLADAAFADTLDVSQGTSADMDAYDGNENTFAMYDNSSVSSPIALQVFSLWSYGQSAYIPSVAQLRLLYAVKESVNPILTALGGEALPSLPDDCWYWSSTEVSGQETAKAWLYSLASGAIQETPKDQRHRVRPIITLNE